MKKIISFILVAFFVALCPLTAMAQVEEANGTITVNLLENAYVVSADGTVKPIPYMDLLGGTELAPGDSLVTSSMVYFNNQKKAVFNASCQYGDVAKLKVYRGTNKNQVSTSLGYFTATQGKWYGELTATIPSGYYYFMVENGGSHNIMVDSVTVNF